MRQLSTAQTDIQQFKEVNCHLCSKIKDLHDRWYAKSNENVAMHLQVPPQNTPLLWQLNGHKHIGSILELLRCRIIIVVTLNLMYEYVQVFRLRKSLILYWMTLVCFTFLIARRWVGSSVRPYDGPDLMLFILVGWGRSFLVCCLAHRG